MIGLNERHSSHRTSYGSNASCGSCSFKSSPAPLDVFPRTTKRHTPSRSIPTLSADWFSSEYGTAPRSLDWSCRKLPSFASDFRQKGKYSKELKRLNSDRINTFTTSTQVQTFLFDSSLIDGVYLTSALVPTKVMCVMTSNHLANRDFSKPANQLITIDLKPRDISTIILFNVCFYNDIGSVFNRNSVLETI